MELDASSTPHILVSEDLGGHHRLTCARRPLDDDVPSSAEQIGYLGTLDGGHKVVKPGCPDGLVAGVAHGDRPITPLFKQ